MKKMTFYCLGILLMTAAHSQITKGNWLVGGSASFRSSKYEQPGGLSSKQTLVQLSGNVGYFIIDKFTLGLKPGYNRTGTNNPHLVYNVYSIGPFARYYLLPPEKYVNIFPELSYQYGIAKTNQTSSSTNSNNLSGLIGCVVFFNSSVALEFTLGYSSYFYNNNSGNVKSVIAGVGFQFHLKRDKNS